ncbi:MAG: Na/Pi cotransporter family protein [Paracoccaceae bacterium]
MDLPLFLLQLAGATMLLLYAVRMVRTGIERASGPAMRRVLIGQGRSRLATAGAGALIAVLMQSSTATALLTAGFAASGLVTFSHGLSVMLGADLGTALVVQILSFKLSWLIPFLLFAGGWLFLKTDGQVSRQSGRIIMGIAFILIALGMISQASEPMRESAFVPEIAGFLSNEPTTAFILGTFIAFAMHSSVAAILLSVTLAAQGVLPVPAGVAIVFGANLGGALLAVWLSRDMAPIARRIPMGNVLLRGAGAILAILALMAFPPMTSFLGSHPGQALVTVHLVFNGLVLLTGLPLVGPIEKLVTRVVADPAGESADQPLRPRSALDANVIDTPRLALACITREVLRMGENVQTMVEPVMSVIGSGDKTKASRIRDLEKEVNKSFDDIRKYVADMSKVGMVKNEARQARELTEFSINLESAADIVVKNLLPIASEVSQKQLSFSSQGWKELVDMHRQVMDNIQLSLNVVVSEDIDSARTLIEEKADMTRRIRSSRKRHLKRLASGEERSFETSDLHLEALHALKEINSMFASVAYPILYRNNQILDTRLVDTIGAENL